MAVTGGTMDPARLGLDRTLLNDPVGALSADPLGAAGKFSSAVGLVLPDLERVAIWMLPLLVVVWIVVSSVGRTLVLRRADARLSARPATLILLQAIRMCALAGMFWVWFRALSWSSGVAINAPIVAGAEPNLILYCALVIVWTLGLFTGWAFVSWVFSVAPLLAMLRNLGTGASLRAARRLGPMRGKLVEINLVMAIVKVALIVLAMVFSATPLPFEDVGYDGVSGVVVGGGHAALSAVVGLLPCGAAGGIPETCGGRTKRQRPWTRTHEHGLISCCAADSASHK